MEVDKIKDIVKSIPGIEEEIAERMLKAANFNLVTKTKFMNNQIVANCVNEHSLLIAGEMFVDYEEHVNELECDIAEKDLTIDEYKKVIGDKKIDEKGIAEASFKIRQGKQKTKLETQNQIINKFLAKIEKELPQRKQKQLK